jgi:FAD/FMN-containing dehydrogenase
MAVRVVASAGGEATVSEEALGELLGRIRGEVVTPEDPGYAAVRPTSNAMFEGRAALAVRCSSTADVVAAVTFARDHGLLLAVRGGGHSVAGLSAGDGAMLIDLSPMNGVAVDPEGQRARVQGGALWADVDREAQAHGLATPGGLISDTGVGGLTLGGGYGWLRRKYGLSCDNVVEAEVVCADGEVRTASAESHPDLYWALRGGGGNFGVVTSFTFALHPVGPTVAFVGTAYPIEETARVARGLRDYMEGTPDEVTAMLVAFTFPAAPTLPPPVHDRPCVVVGAVYAGEVDDGMALMQPLRELAEPVVDLTHPAAYTFVQSSFDGMLPRHTMRSYWKSQYLGELSDAAVDAFATLALNRPAPLTVMNLWPMGGAVNRVDPEATAFAERSAPWMVSIDGNWADPAMDEEGIAWVRSAWSTIGEFGTGGVYLNFTGLAGEAPTAGVDSALGRNLRRLAGVKATYDPGNLFRLNNNITPA